MKPIKKIISRGVKESRCCYSLFVPDGEAGNDETYVLPDAFYYVSKGTPIEIAALIKPKMIRPEGLVWVAYRPIFFPLVRALTVGGLIIAVVSKLVCNEDYSHKWTWGNKEGRANSEASAIESAEHALADDGLFGFGWEEQDETN